jgi:hypothetical protein
MKITKLTKTDPCGCGGYTKMPKDKEHSGKLDTQLFYECPGWPSYQKKNKKKAFNLKEFFTKKAAPFSPFSNDDDSNDWIDSSVEESTIEAAKEQYEYDKNKAKQQDIENTIVQLNENKNVNFETALQNIDTQFAQYLLHLIEDIKNQADNPNKESDVLKVKEDINYYSKSFKRNDFYDFQYTLQDYIESEQEASGESRNPYKARGLRQNDFL